MTVIPEKNKWKFLDFRAPDQADSYFNPNIYAGFKKSNSIFNYDYADFMKDVFLHPDNVARKFKMANEIILDLTLGRICNDGVTRKLPLIAAIEKACHDIIVYITENNTYLKIDLQTGTKDLSDYAAASKKNFELLKQGIATNF